MKTLLQALLTIQEKSQLILSKINANCEVIRLKKKLEFQIHSKENISDIYKTYTKLYNLLTLEIAKYRDTYTFLYTNITVVYYFTDDKANIVFSSRFEIQKTHVQKFDNNLDQSFSYYIQNNSSFPNYLQTKLIQEVVEHKTLKWKDLMLSDFSIFTGRYTPGAVATSTSAVEGTQTTLVVSSIQSNITTYDSSYILLPSGNNFILNICGAGGNGNGNCGGGSGGYIQITFPKYYNYTINEVKYQSILQSITIKLNYLYNNKIGTYANFFYLENSEFHIGSSLDIFAENGGDATDSSTPGIGGTTSVVDDDNVPITNILKVNGVDGAINGSPGTASTAPYKGYIPPGSTRTTDEVLSYTSSGSASDTPSPKVDGMNLEPLSPEYIYSFGGSSTTPAEGYGSGGSISAVSNLGTTGFFEIYAV